ncbi:DUF2218 domain-containing protein [Shimia sp. R9_1]|nr:DUF2218 domain-containing protein [Shimia sp. R9_1]MBO9409605.1 DUF2218 domain-containing protein [Shimia sp. R9_1]
MRVRSEFRSPWVAQYFSTMVKHFSEKIDVERTDDTAKLTFVCGVADLALQKGCLRMDITSPTNDELIQTCDVIERHLQRFAFREAPEPLVWEAAGE